MLKNQPIPSYRRGNGTLLYQVIRSWENRSPKSLLIYKLRMYLRMLTITSLVDPFQSCHTDIGLTYRYIFRCEYVRMYAHTNMCTYIHVNHLEIHTFYAVGFN